MSDSPPTSTSGQDTSRGNDQNTPSNGNLFKLNLPQIVRNITTHPGLTPTDVRFALIVIDAAGYERRGECTRSMNSITRQVRIKVRQGWNVAKKLQELQILEVEHETGSRHSGLIMKAGFLALNGPRYGMHDVGNGLPTKCINDVGNLRCMTSAIDSTCSRQFEVHDVGNGLPTNELTERRDSTKGETNVVDDVAPPDLNSQEEERIPESILAVIQAELGSHHAADAARNVRQCRDACGGNWGLLAIAAREVGPQKRNGKAKTPLGLMLHITKTLRNAPGDESPALAQTTPIESDTIEKDFPKVFAWAEKFVLSRMEKGIPLKTIGSEIKHMCPDDDHAIRAVNRAIYLMQVRGSS